MPRLRVAVVMTLAALVAPLAACVSTPPAPSPAPTSAPATITAVTATQSAGPLGDGATGIERTDAASLAALADVLAMGATAREDIECVWSTRTTVAVAWSDGATTTSTAESCGATGRDQALGLLVAEWATEEG